jgi:putative flippase GtrA
LRALKFLATGATGYLVHLAILCAAVECFGATPALGAVIGFATAMTSNYTMNRIWTFRARGAPVFSSYIAYALGALGGLWIQLVFMEALSRFHYAVGATLGIAAGSLFIFLTSHLWAFAKR